MASLATFVLFYLMTVFALSWGTTALGYTPRAIPLHAVVRHPVLRRDDSAVGGPRRRAGGGSTLIVGDGGIAPSASSWRRCLVAGTAGAMFTMALGLSLMGLTYGPLGTVLSELFPTSVRYTGSSLTFNFAGIFGASLAPYIATWLAKTYGLQYVGYYLSAGRVRSPWSVARPSRETKDEDLVEAGS